MSRRQPKAPLLDAAGAVFITHRVAMNVASCSAACEPSLARAYGCRVSADRRRVTMFMPVQRSTALLEDLRAGSAIAVVFTQPRTHETLQLKGAKAEIVRLQASDAARARTYAQSFIDEISALGYPMLFARTFAAGAQEELIGLEFEPTAAFVQTPGPNAGRPLEAKP
jgi:hypothetical protein